MSHSAYNQLLRRAQNNNVTVLYSLIFMMSFGYKFRLMWLNFFLYPYHVIYRFMLGVPSDALAQRDKILRDGFTPQDECSPSLELEAVTAKG